MFQVLDDKGICVGIYKDGKLCFNDIPEVLDKTWNYVDFLKGRNIEYANLYASGAKLEDCCPAHLKSDLEICIKKFRSFINSFVVSKVDLKQNCIYDLVPSRFLKEFCEVKNKICEDIFEKYNRPEEYTFFREFTEFIHDTSRRELKIDKDILSGRIFLPQGKKLWEKVNNNSTSIKFNMFSSVTGRLTVAENSFPILNLNSKLRDVVVPTNDWFVSFDLNAAEMRIALALAGEKQIAGDLHDHVRKELFGEDVSRTSAKSISTQWLYDARSEEVLKYDSKLSSFYNKNKLFNDFWKNGTVITPFNRKIESDSHHVISYLCQSTLIDMFHRQILKIVKKLNGKESFVAFPLHDQVVIDLKESEKNILPDLITELSNTPYGIFPVKVEIGSNFGNMKKINIKV